MMRSGLLLMGTSLGNTSNLTIVTLRRVLSRWQYAFVALVAGVGLLTVISLLPHHVLLREVVLSHASLANKFELVLTLLLYLGGNTNLMGGTLLLSIGMLFGVQSALLLYYIRRRRSGVRLQFRTGAASLGGVVAALFGVGCAACGSVIATALLGLFGATGILLLLPFHGQEFMLLGIVALLWSILYLAKHINDPLVCMPN